MQKEISQLKRVNQEDQQDQDSKRILNLKTNMESEYQARVEEIRQKTQEVEAKMKKVLEEREKLRKINEGRQIEGQP